MREYLLLPVEHTRGAQGEERFYSEKENRYTSVSKKSKVILTV